MNTCHMIGVYVKSLNWRQAITGMFQPESRHYSRMDNAC